MKIIYISILLLLQTTLLSAQVDRSVEPEPDQPKEINLGDLKSIELENGLKVFLVPKPGYGKIAFSLTINQPDIKNDPQAELRNILSKIYYKNSSQNYTRQVGDSLIAFNGAKMGVTINGGYVIGLKENTNELLNLYTDRIFNPILNQDTIKALVEDSKTKLEKKKNTQKNKREITKTRDFGVILMDSLMNDGSTNNDEYEKDLNYDLVTVSKLNAFQKERIVSNHSTAILIGDFTPKSAEKLLNKYFGTWQKGKELTKQKDKNNEAVFLKNRKIFVIDNPLAVQSSVSFNWNLGDAYQYFNDEVKLVVMNQILGGYTNSYIYTNLREDKGLCYFAISSISPTGAGGRGFAKVDVRTEKTDIAVENIIYEMLRIRNQTVSDKTLRMAKNSLIGAYARSLGGVALQRFLSFAMVKDDFNLPDDYLKTYPFKIGEVSREEVQEMALKYVKPNNCLILVKGNASELKGKLEAYGPVEYYTEEGKKLDF
jgi:predicted Zn-dependent peptidase